MKRISADERRHVAHILRLREDPGWERRHGAGRADVEAVDRQPHWGRLLEIFEEVPAIRGMPGLCGKSRRPNGHDTIRRSLAVDSRKQARTKRQSPPAKSPVAIQNGTHLMRWNCPR